MTARRGRPCRLCGGGGVICREARGTTMWCPEPAYDDEFDMLGVCPHRVPCPACGGKGEPMYDTIEAHAREWCKAWLEQIKGERRVGACSTVEAQAIALGKFVEGIVPERRRPDFAPLFEQVRAAARARIEELTR